MLWHRSGRSTSLAAKLIKAGESDDAPAGIGPLLWQVLTTLLVDGFTEAGCTIPQIAAITDHQLDRTLRILETYLPRNTEMARAAIHTLES